MEDTKKNEMWGKVMAPLAGFLAIVLVAFLIILKLLESGVIGTVMAMILICVIVAAVFGGIFMVIKSILDQIRKMDWIPRTIRQKQKKIDAAMKEIETTTGRAATDEEIAQKLEISTDEFADWQSQMKITGVVSLNEFMESGSEIPAEQHNQHRFEEPEEVIEKEELREVLGQALELLTEKEKKVILLYYYEDLTLKEISNVLEVSESRVSQLHTRALQKMKVRMGNYMGVFKA